MSDDPKGQNHTVEEVNTIVHPETKSMIDRYVFVSNFCKGKTVLDCPTGYGFGAAIVKALGAESVTGIDIDLEALSYARKQYPYVFFFNKDLTVDWSGDVTVNGVFDTVLCVEGFEHVERANVQVLLQNLKHACKPGGTVIITTPKRKDGQSWVDYGLAHRYEYTASEFKEELRVVFPEASIVYYAGLQMFLRPFTQELSNFFNKDFLLDDKRCTLMLAVIQL